MPVMGDGIQRGPIWGLDYLGAVFVSKGGGAEGVKCD